MRKLQDAQAIVEGLVDLVPSDSLLWRIPNDIDDLYGVDKLTDDALIILASAANCLNVKDLPESLGITNYAVNKALVVAREVLRAESTAECIVIAQHHKLIDFPSVHVAPDVSSHLGIEAFAYIQSIAFGLGTTHAVYSSDARIDSIQDAAREVLTRTGLQTPLQLASWAIKNGSVQTFAQVNHFDQ